MVEVADAHAPDVVKVTHDSCSCRSSLETCGIDQDGVLPADDVAVVHDALHAVVINQQRFGLRTALRRRIGNVRFSITMLLELTLNAMRAAVVPLRLLLLLITNNRSGTALSAEGDVVLTRDIHDFHIIAIVDVDHRVIVVAGGEESTAPCTVRNRRCRLPPRPDWSGWPGRPFWS